MKHYPELWGDRKDVKAFSLLKLPKREKEKSFLSFSGITFWGEGHKTIKSLTVF